MIYLLITVAMTVWIFVCFKGYEIYQIETLQAITVNYLTCVVTGLFFTGLEPLHLVQNTYQNWIIIPPFLGIGFIIGFYLISIATQRIGISTTTLINRMSLIIPLIFSLFVFKIQTQYFSLLNYLGLGIGFVSIFMSSYSKTNQKTQKKNYWMLIFVFLIGGLTDTILNYSNMYLQTEADRLVFPICVFATAGLGGVSFILYQYIHKQKTVEAKNILAGIVLGIPNYFSIYFTIKSLEYYQNNGAFVFPILNILILVFSTIVGRLFFKEKLQTWNYIGLVLAIGGLTLLLEGEIW